MESQILIDSYPKLNVLSELSDWNKAKKVDYLGEIYACMYFIFFILYYVPLFL